MSYFEFGEGAGERAKTGQEILKIKRTAYEHGPESQRRELYTNSLQSDPVGHSDVHPLTIPDVSRNFAVVRFVCEIFDNYTVSRSRSARRGAEFHGRNRELVPVDCGRIPT